MNTNQLQVTCTSLIWVTCYLGEHNFICMLFKDRISEFVKVETGYHSE